MKVKLKIQLLTRLRRDVIVLASLIIYGSVCGCESGDRKEVAYVRTKSYGHGGTHNPELVVRGRRA